MGFCNQQKMDERTSTILLCTRARYVYVPYMCAPTVCVYEREHVLLLLLVFVSLLFVLFPGNKMRSPRGLIYHIPKKIWKIICLCIHNKIYRHSLLPSSLKLYLFCAADSESNTDFGIISVPLSRSLSSFLSSSLLLSTHPNAYFSLCSVCKFFSSFFFHSFFRIY